MSDQMIFKRYEIKYMLTVEQQSVIKKFMESYMEADEHGRSTILSLYCDTPDFLLARRSMEHPAYKEKLRLRSYGLADADTTVFVELKKKYDSVVYKRRIAVAESNAVKYLRRQSPVEDTQIGREIGYCMDHYHNLAPRVLLSYEREAFYAKDNHDFRVTFDQNILWRDQDTDLTSGVYGDPLLSENQVLMEVKTAGGIPVWMTHLLSENHLYPTSFSKYAAAYRVIHRKGGNYKYA